MKKTVLVIALYFFYIAYTKAQQAVASVNFENKLSWAAIKQKAKAENKYIFLDFNTSWCIPCKRMEKEVFTDNRVHDILNEHFINVALQCDTGKNDIVEIISRYKDAAFLKDQFKIYSYPTYMILNPNGEFVHKIMGYTRAENFALDLQMSLNPNTQYATLIGEYNNGNRESKFLFDLIKACKRLNDYAKLSEYINSYLATQNNLLSAENISFILEATKKSSDIGFRILTKYPSKIDSIAGKNVSSDMVSNIVFDEIAVSFLRENGKAEKKTDAMMVIYHGELNKTVDWVGFKKVIDANYPKFSENIINISKANYYSWGKDWPKLSKLISLQIIKNGFSYRFIDRKAYSIFLECSDEQILKVALAWYNDKQLFKSEDGFWIKSSLLYKLGRTTDAVALLKSHIKADDIEQNTALKRAIKEMEAGYKPWAE